MISPTSPGEAPGRAVEHPRTAVWLLAALVVLHVIPFWAFGYFPSQDGPSHIENSYALANYDDAGRAYREFYDVNWRPVPNWLSHATLALLMKLLPPLASERVLLTGYVVLFALGLLYFIRSTCGRGKDWPALVAFPLVSTYLLHMGFYNFVISVPLAFLAVGYWWRRRDAAPGWKSLTVLNLILTLVYFASVLSQAVALFCIIGLAALYYGWSRRQGIRRTLALAASLLPCCVLPLYFVLSSPREPSVPGGDPVRWRYLLGVEGLVSFDSAERYLGVALAAIVGGLAVLALARRPRWTPGDRGFLAVALALIAIYFVAPAKALGGGLLVQRLSLFPLIVILPWIGARVAGRVQAGAGLAAVALALVHLGISVQYYAALNRGLEEFTSGVGLVGSSETILPLTFDQKGEAERIRVYRHASSYYCLESGAISLSNYEGDKSYFPLMYKRELNPFLIMGRIESQRGTVSPQRYPRPIDWVLLWSAPDQFPAWPWIEANYELAHQRGDLKLFRRMAADAAPGAAGAGAAAADGGGPEPSREAPPGQARPVRGRRLREP